MTTPPILGRRSWLQIRRIRCPTLREFDAIVAALNRLDRASPIGAWSRATPLPIDELPATRAPDLAQRSRRDTPLFKQNVRKLKERGPTESLDIGYRLSPRGSAGFSGTAVERMPGSRDLPH